MAKPPSECANVVDLPAASVADASSPGESVSCVPDSGNPGHAPGGCGSVRPTPQSFEFLTRGPYAGFRRGSRRFSDVNHQWRDLDQYLTLLCCRVYRSSRRCRRRPPRGGRWFLSMNPCDRILKTCRRGGDNQAVKPA